MNIFELITIKKKKSIECKELVDNQTKIHTNNFKWKKKWIQCYCETKIVQLNSNTTKKCINTNKKNSK